MEDWWLQGRGGIKGKNSENCNSIVNKIYLEKESYVWELNRDSQWRVTVPPGGHLAMFGDFCCCGCHHQGIKILLAAKHPTMYRTGPAPIMNDLAPNINSADIEQP